MITDQDVVRSFSKIESVTINPSEVKSTYQLYRGIPGLLRKDFHPRGCTHHHNIFNTCGVIPKNCFNCFKVIVTPRNVMELFKLLMVFEKIALPLDNARKCMVEVRDYCSGAYKGFVYCMDIKEAYAVYEIVRNAVSEDISPQVSVALKRGCSEFAQVYPEYERVEQGRVFMQYKDEWQSQEELYDRDSIFPVINGNPNIRTVNASGRVLYTQSDICCMQYWLRYAATIGDVSYLAIAGKELQPLQDINRPPF